MAVFIDGDGCPVTDIAVSCALRRKIPVTIICDTCHEIIRDGAKTITVDKGGDSADYYLINLVKPGDIVITGDYPLAAMALSKKAVPVSHFGMIYSDGNIDSLLMTRHIKQKIRRRGGRLKGPPKRTKEDDAKFLAALEKVLG